MNIRRWPVGKLIILWCWCGIPAYLLFTDFQMGKVHFSAGRYWLELLCSLFLLAALSAITWHWLGDRKTD